jgi:twinkle protein
MTKLASMVRELGFTLFLISHLSSSADKSHEEGGRVTIKHFRGSRAIGQWADTLWALERNQQAENATERHTSTFRILKDRYTGQAVGTTFQLYFDSQKNSLKEVDSSPDVFNNEIKEGDPNDFTDF